MVHEFDGQQKDRYGLSGNETLRQLVLTRLAEER